VAIHDVIETFLDRLDQIRAFVESLFSSIGRIARGQLD
jgi:hypothetical protein